MFWGLISCYTSDVAGGFIVDWLFMSLSIIELELGGGLVLLLCWLLRYKVEIL